MVALNKESTPNQSTPEVLKQDKILVLYNFLSKMVVCKGNTDFPDTLERRIEIKEPLPGL